MRTADEKLAGLESFAKRGGRWLESAEIWRRPLPALRAKPLTRLLTRLILGVGQVTSVRGAEIIAPERDAFILALNHSTQLEAALVPSVLAFCRGGKLVHFMADWNFLLIPLVGLIIRRGESIIVGRKPARPKVLNLLRPIYVDGVPPMRRAAEILRRGGSVGIFPEGTVNRHPSRLLPGDYGAARLSLETGAPVVPAGIRYPTHEGPGRVSNWTPMELEFGPALTPARPTSGQRARPEEVREWHALIMSEVARIAGKPWTPPAQQRTNQEP